MVLYINNTDYYQPDKSKILSPETIANVAKRMGIEPNVALQLTEAGVPLTRRDTIQYIYRDAAHSNPLRRVTPVEFIEEGCSLIPLRES